MLIECIPAPTITILTPCTGEGYQSEIEPVNSLAEQANVCAMFEDAVNSFYSFLFLLN